MSGLLSGFTIKGGSTIGRSFYNATTDGMIHDDAGHWSIESYIPLKAGTLAEYLLGRGELPEKRHAEFRQLCEEIDRLHHERTGAYHRQFTALYASVDPDSDCKPLCTDLRDESSQVPSETSLETSAEQKLTAQSTTEKSEHAHRLSEQDASGTTGAGNAQYVDTQSGDAAGQKAQEESA